MWFGGFGGYGEAYAPWGNAAISQRAADKLEEAKRLFRNHVALVDVSAGPVSRRVTPCVEGWRVLGAAARCRCLESARREAEEAGEAARRIDAARAERVPLPPLLPPLLPPSLCSARMRSCPSTWSRTPRRVGGQGRLPCALARPPPRAARRRPVTIPCPPALALPCPLQPTQSIACRSSSRIT